MIEINSHGACCKNLERIKWSDVMNSVLIWINDKFWNILLLSIISQLQEIRSTGVSVLEEGHWIDLTNVLYTLVIVPVITWPKAKLLSLLSLSCYTVIFYRLSNKLTKSWERSLGLIEMVFRDQMTGVLERKQWIVRCGASTARLRHASDRRSDSWWCTTR